MSRRKLHCWCNVEESRKQQPLEGALIKTADPQLNSNGFWFKSNTLHSQDIDWDIHIIGKISVYSFKEMKI